MTFLSFDRWPHLGRLHIGRPLLQRWAKAHDATWSIESCDAHQLPYFVECNSDTLDVSVNYPDGEGLGNAIDHLYETLTTCHNIRSLSLQLSQGGCDVSGPSPRSFRWEEGKLFPDLEALTISGYDWDARESSWCNRNSPSGVEAWKSAMDWRKLKHLNIDLPPKSFLEAFHSELNSLDSLSLRPRWTLWGDETSLCDFDNATDEIRQNYTSFITSLPPLQTLSVSGTGHLLDLNLILATHGSSIRSLTLHEFERACATSINDTSWSRPTLDPIQLHQLSTMSPNLESLALDLHRDHGQWPTSTFSLLALNRNLSNLTLHFDFEDPTHIHRTERCAINEAYWDQYCIVPALKEPLLNQESALEIFKTIRKQQLGSKLTQLTVYAGDRGGRSGGGLRMDAHIEHNTPVKFVCGLIDNTKETCEAVAKPDDDFARWEEEHEKLYQRVDEMAGKGIWATDGYGGVGVQDQAVLGNA